MKFLAALLFLFFAITALTWACPGKAVTIKVTASMIQRGDNGFTGGWDPRVIIVSEGDDVTLQITSLDVDHGFRLSAFGIDQYIPSQKTVTVHFNANKTGRFPFECDVYCGPYHRYMKGYLIVK